MISLLFLVIIKTFNVSSRGSVLQAIVVFLESTSFEETIRNAASIGGDSDTFVGIAGNIAWQLSWREGTTDEMSQIWNDAKRLLAKELLQAVEGFEVFYAKGDENEKDNDLRSGGTASSRFVVGM